MLTKSFLASLVSVLVLIAGVANGQSYETVLYSFGINPGDGSIPNGGVVFDSAGNFYGTTQRGGANTGGTVFELTPSEGGWSETVLYNFCSQAACLDGAVPNAGLILDHDGNLFGTTALGGSFSNGSCGDAGCGTVFELMPPHTPGADWSEKVIWNFQGALFNDGAQPVSRLNRDKDGNLYGTTVDGGSEASFGTVFQLTPNQDGSWTERVLYAFCSSGVPCPDGENPFATVTIDEEGNLYGTTHSGAFDGQWGTVYRLSPQQGGEWSETTVFRFTPQTGGNSLSIVNFDSAGNIYGTVSGGPLGGPTQCGGVWKLTPHGQHIKETSSVLDSSGSNGCQPTAGVFIDTKGKAAYSTAFAGGTFNGGTVFRTTPTTQAAVYNFCQQPGCIDGSSPVGSMTLYKGALYGTTSKGGLFNKGVVFKITP